MTDTPHPLAALLRDVPIRGRIYTGGNCLDELVLKKDVLAALTLPDMDEAGKVLEHVNETPKSEHDAGNVLTDAALIDRLREIQGQAGLFASAAADRIAALTAQVERMREALEKIAEQPDYRLPKPQDIARAAITEETHE